MSERHIHGVSLEQQERFNAVLNHGRVVKIIDHMPKIPHDAMIEARLPLHARVELSRLPAFLQGITADEPTGIKLLYLRNYTNNIGTKRSNDVKEKIARLIPAIKTTPAFAEIIKEHLYFLNLVGIPLDAADQPRYPHLLGRIKNMTHPAGIFNTEAAKVLEIDSFRAMRERNLRKNYIIADQVSMESTNQWETLIRDYYKIEGPLYDPFHD